MNVRYENAWAQRQSVLRAVRPNIGGPPVRIVFDPRVCESPDMVGTILAASSVTDMMAVQVSERDGDDTLRYRQRTDDGWLVSVPLAEVLDVVRL